MIKALEPYSAINFQNVRQEIIKVASDRRASISKEVAGKLVKFDCCTRLDRSILGINIQYAEKCKIVQNPLGMIEVYGRHTGKHIKELILECISSYRTSTNQIYSLTTDNGSNMIKSVQLFLEGDKEEEDIDFDELDINNDEDEE